MESATELLTNLSLPSANLNADMAVENAITVYSAAKAGMDQYAAAADAAKQRLAEIIEETGVTKHITRAGTVQVTSPSVSVSYDTKSLDALCASSDEMARLLSPHRKESQRAGTLRITVAK